MATLPLHIDPSTDRVARSRASKECGGVNAVPPPVCTALAVLGRLLELEHPEVLAAAPWLLHHRPHPWQTTGLRRHELGMVTVWTRNLSCRRCVSQVQAKVTAHTITCH